MPPSERGGFARVESGVLIICGLRFQDMWDEKDGVYISDEAACGKINAAHEADKAKEVQAARAEYLCKAHNKFFLRCSSCVEIETEALSKMCNAMTLTHAREIKRRDKEINVLKSLIGDLKAKFEGKEK